MTATIITGHFEKPVEPPCDQERREVSDDVLSPDQVAEVRKLATQWNTNVAGAVLMIVSAYLETKERA